MMKIFVAVLSVFALLQIATCRPSGASIPDAFTKDSKIELPGSERINKRSVETSKHLKTPSEDDNLEFLGGSSVSDIKALESNEDFEAAAIDFHPLPVFGKRSVNKREISEDIQGTHKRFLRSSNIDDESDDEMKIAENGLVFLPMFRARNGVARNQRSRRSAQDVDKTEVLLNRAEMDDLVGAETIIFRPVFRSQLRPVRSILEKDLVDDDMVVAENGLIFRPVFRTRQTGSA